MKCCSTCRVEKPLDDFYKNAKRCKACERDYQKKYRDKNRTRLNAQRKKWYANLPTEHKDRINKRQLEYNKNRKDFIRAYDKKWRKENPDKVKRYKQKCHEQLMKEDIQYKLASNLRRRLLTANYRGGSAVRHLGCSVAELKAYLEDRFEQGMSWENYGRKGWHIDHIIPLSHFDLSNEDDIKVACHYTNLQPMWAKHNLRKGNRYVGKKKS